MKRDHDPAIAGGHYFVTLWRKDRMKLEDIPSGEGVAFHVEQELAPGSSIVPFARYSYGHGAGLRIRQSLALGVGFEAPFERKDERFGVAMSWAQPMRPGKPDQYGLADRMLQALVMDCLSQLYDTPAPSRASDIQARQAEAWIDAHLAEPIGVEEVATAVSVSVRSLEQTFKRTRGYSPYQAILRMRFERAREALLNADETATVTQIAIDHGFFELGRFSVRYRQRYGESPSQTLKRRLQARRFV